VAGDATAAKVASEARRVSLPIWRTATLANRSMIEAFAAQPVVLRPGAFTAIHPEAISCSRTAQDPCASRSWSGPHPLQSQMLVAGQGPQPRTETMPSAPIASPDDATPSGLLMLLAS
jgi:hypothetical protein